MVGADVEWIIERFSVGSAGPAIESGGSIERKGRGAWCIQRVHDPVRPTGRAEEVNNTGLN